MRDVVPSAEAVYLPNPLSTFPGVVPASLETAVPALHRRLIVEGPGESLESELRSLQRAAAGHPVLQVLLAETRLVERRLSEVVELLEPIAVAHPGYVPALLALARAHELGGETTRAFEVFRRAAERSSIAAERQTELRPRVVEMLGDGIEEAIHRGQLLDAGERLKLLEEIAPSSEEALHGRWRVAVASGDAAAELEALTSLLSVRRQDDGLVLRQAELELELGRPRRAVEILEQLVEESPGDRSLAATLAVAKFYWRLDILPPDVRQLADSPVLDRAQFGRLVFWLVPGVRAADMASAQIATDILDHPNRSELVRVINLQLMEVDPALHRFYPERPVTRIDVLSSLLQALVLSGHELGCVSELLGHPRPSIELRCETASRCGLLDHPADCLPSAALSGREALEMVRRALAALGSVE